MSYPNDHPCRDCGTGWQSANANGEYQGCHDSCEKLKAWNAAHPKPIREWTLADIQQWCYEHRTGKINWPCEESGCMLRKRGICSKEWVHDWDLEEKPRFTEEEVVAAKMLYKVGARSIERSDYQDGDIAALAEKKPDGSYRCWHFPRALFPSVQPGKEVKLADIIG